MVRYYLIALVLFLTACNQPKQYHSVSFYICAHADDCVLFMNPNLLEDIARPGNKVVSIYLTAGDAGHGNGGEEGKAPYYLVREKGTIAAMRWMSDLHSMPTSSVINSSYESVGNRKIAKYEYKESETYFMRLPDGMYTGEGAKRTGLQSLARLKSGEVTLIDAVDGSARYDGWNSLVTTLQDIILRESAGIPRVALNIQDPDKATNIDDHSDHMHTGLLALDAVKDFPCIAVGEFQDYVTARKPRNIDDKHLKGDLGAYEVLSSALAKEGYIDIWDKEHRENLQRNYFKFKEAAENCRF